jgi:sugar-specific transcriptional regulator TrmB
MFEALGLEPADSAVYVALVGNPRASAGELATTARLSPAQTRCALVRLAERGLVSRLPGRPMRYLAAPPDAAIGELIGAVESELWQARDAAQALMETHRAASRYTHPEQSLEVLVGQDTIGRRVAHIESSAKTQIRAALRRHARRGCGEPGPAAAPGRPVSGDLQPERGRLARAATNRPTRHAARG